MFFTACFYIRKKKKKNVLLLRLAQSHTQLHSGKF